MEAAVGPLQVRLTAKASDDLLSILDYLAGTWGDILAVRYFGALSRSIATLADLPDRGAARPRLGRGVRVLLHAPHAVYYRVVGPEVVVLRVIHGARDVVLIARRGGLNEG